MAVETIRMYAFSSNPPKNPFWGLLLMIKVSNFEEKRGSFKSGGSFKWAPLGVTLPTSRGLQTTDVTTHALTTVRQAKFQTGDPAQ